ncbi:RskA family anti-sigma factor [Nocardia sp. R16R-3T]
MDDARIDLAHAVALGSIDDEDHNAVREVLDGEDPALHAEFMTEVQQTKEVLAVLAEATAARPPVALRAGLLAAIAAEQPPVAS